MSKADRLLRVSHPGDFAGKSMPRASREIVGDRSGNIANLRKWPCKADSGGSAAMPDCNPVSSLEVFAVIGGKKVLLPADANYVEQDRRGLWYFCNRKPRPKEGHWTPKKPRIAALNDGGYIRALKTATVVPWLDTCQRTVRVLTDANGKARRPAAV